jgi:RHS repeat-associated protein
LTHRSFITGDNTVEDITVTGAGALSYSYTYDDNKNVTGESVGGSMSDYTFSANYDEENRLTSWSRSSGDSQSWGLSPVGNWDTFTKNSTPETRTHNSVHELTAIGSNSLTYDNRGNLTANTDTRTFAWNWDNLLTSTTAHSATGFDASYRYDILNRRVAKQVSDTTDPMNPVDRYVLFVNSLEKIPPLGTPGGQVLMEYEKTGTGSYAKARAYTYGEYCDEPLTLVDYTAVGSIAAGTAETFYYHRNRVFNIVGLTDSSGNVAELYAYEPYGGVVILDPSTLATRTSSALSNATLFTGRYFDAETGLYYFRARYLTSWGFISRDPMEYIDGGSLYRAYFVPGGMDSCGLQYSAGGEWGWLGWKVWWEYLPVVSTIGHANVNGYLDGTHVYDYTSCKPDLNSCPTPDDRDQAAIQCSACVNKAYYRHLSNWVGVPIASDLAEAGVGLGITGPIILRSGSTSALGAVTGGILTIDSLADAGITLDGINAIGKAAKDALSEICGL